MHNRRFIQLTVIISFLSSQISFAAPKTDTIPGLKVMDSALHFLVMGDWGRMGSPPQRQVANVMGMAAQQLNTSFIITTGDNFYPAGVTSVNDSQWIYSFEKVYDAPSLRRKWLAVLGNHDQTNNPDAQVAYTFQSPYWYMPARYYDTTIAATDDSILFVFLDTEPIELKLREKVLDSIKYSTDYVDKQLSWLKQVLAQSTARWKIVTGHHPLHTGGSRRHNKRIKKLRALLQPVFIDHRVNFYISGHEHHLELLKPKGHTPYYIISGAASDRNHVGYLKRWRRFAARKKGFVSMSVSSQGWLIQFISEEAKVIGKKFILPASPASHHDRPAPGSLMQQ
jgi:hypothetical protein